MYVNTSKDPLPWNNYHAKLELFFQRRHILTCTRRGFPFLVWWDLVVTQIYCDMFMTLLTHHVTMLREDFKLQAVIRKLQSKNIYHPSIVCSEESEKYSHLRYVKKMTIVFFMLIWWYKCNNKVFFILCVAFVLKQKAYKSGNWVIFNWCNYLVFTYFS